MTGKVYIREILETVGNKSPMVEKHVVYRVRVPRLSQTNRLSQAHRTRRARAEVAWRTWALRYLDLGSAAA